MWTGNWKQFLIRYLLRGNGRFLWLVVIILTACTAGNSETAATPTALPEATPLTEPVMRYETMIMNDGTALRYALILPAGFTPAQSFPALLALPPGPQTQEMVEAGLTYWQEEAEKRGWVVVSPIAPDGLLFFQGSDLLMPEFLDRIEGMVTVENGRFHIAGVSNGGISAFRIAAAEPERFQSMLVLPGMPAHESDFDSLDRLVALPIAMYVGERDTEWVGEMQKTEARLAELGTAVTLNIMPGEGHVIRSISGAELFDFFEAQRPSPGQ